MCLYYFDTINTNLKWESNEMILHILSSLNCGKVKFPSTYFLVTFCLAANYIFLTAKSLLNGLDKHCWMGSTGYKDICKSLSLISDDLPTYLGIWHKQQYKSGEILERLWSQRKMFLYSQPFPHLSSLSMSNIWHILPIVKITILFLASLLQKNLSQFYDYENRW